MATADMQRTLSDRFAAIEMMTYNAERLGFGEFRDEPRWLADRKGPAPCPLGWGGQA